ncbi:MAG: hypothetical protein ACX94C_11785 [Phycisphaerales bacterium]
MAGYARHVLQAGGGAYHKVARPVDGGAYATVSRDPDGDCVPCGCDEGPCGEECRPYCEGPGCTKDSSSDDVECFDIVFAGYRLRERCTSPSGLLEEIREVFAFPDRIRVYREGISTRFSGRFPILTRYRSIWVDTGAVETEIYSTEQEFVCFLNHCVSPQGDDDDEEERCPIVGLMSMGSLGTFTGGSFSTGISQRFYFFGVEIPNQVPFPFGCPNSGARRPFIMNNAVAVPAPDCGDPYTNYYWQICGGSERITVDLTTRPDGDAINVRHNGSVYTPTGEQSSEDAVSVTWVSEGCPPPGGGGGGSGGPGGTDVGGGLVDRPTLTDPAMVAEIQRQQMARTGQYPGRCPECGNG